MQREGGEVRIISQLPTLGVYTKSFPTSAVTFHPPICSSAYESLHQTNKLLCEQTTDVDIKPRGK